MGIFSRKKKVVEPKVTFESDLENNLNGIELEKSGNIDQAIQLYEKNIKHRFQGNHPYDRLAIIYRKRKDSVNEKRVLEIAIDVFTNDVPKSRPDRLKKLNRFKDRLAKIK
ncbi:tetratricopeptide repeat protein [Enterococcus durans]|uniref:tetratricopeptide repeat protein n=1 Tax=Enterococcus durans TaxID=53345 RepID=UPI003BD2D419